MILLIKREPLGGKRLMEGRTSRQYSQHSLITYDQILQEHQNLWRRHDQKYKNSAFKIQEIAFRGRKKSNKFPVVHAPGPHQVDTTI